MLAKISLFLCCLLLLCRLYSFFSIKPRDWLGNEVTYSVSSGT